MPIDVVTLKAVCFELNNLLTGGRVEKIYQPETDEVTFAVKSGGKLRQLVVSANPTHPRIHLTTQKKENAYNAPAFCMLLRKYLGGAQIKGVEIFNNDRIVRMTFEGKTELKDSRTVYLLAELMGRYSNIILVSEDMTIIDAVRRIHFDQSTTRYILPGLSYVFQPQTRMTFDMQEKLRDFLSTTPDLTPATILQNISGIGKETALEIYSYDNKFEALNNIINATTLPDLYHPCLSYKNDKPTDYFIYPYRSIQTSWKFFPSLNEALDEYYTLYDTEDRKKASSKTVETILKRLQTKTDRRIEDNLKRLSDWEKAEGVRKNGELVTNYLYMIHAGDDKLTCYDYYDDKEVTVPLDPTLSPARNAQEYFKKYNKLKRAKDAANKQLEELYPQKEYLKNVAVAIQNCTLKSEFDEILSELNTLGGYIRKKQTYKKEQSSKPTHLIIDGIDVYFGKNNVQNAQVTFSIGSGDDTWVHAKNHHGTHLIIKGRPTESVLLRCAQIAAYFSDAKSSSKVEVDYTLRKNVKKIPGALLGLVTYTDYKTILCEPLSPEETN